MTTKTLAALALALGMLTMTSPSQAGSGPIGITAKDIGIHKVHQKKFNNRHFHRRHFEFGHGWYGYRGCGRFYRKARWTGSRYWWKRYRRCVAHQHYRY